MIHSAAPGRTRRRKPYSSASFGESPGCPYWRQLAALPHPLHAQCLAHIPKGDKAVVAAAVRTIFAQPKREAAGQQLQYVAEKLQSSWPRAAQVLLEGEEDVLAYMAFPKEHWTRIYSTNIVERLNKEIKRRIRVVETFPDIPSLIRLVGALLAEMDDEWQVGRRYFSQESMRKFDVPGLDLLAEPTSMTLAPVR